MSLRGYTVCYLSSPGTIDSIHLKRSSFGLHDAQFSVYQEGPKSHSWMYTWQPTHVGVLLGSWWTFLLVCIVPRGNLIYFWNLSLIMLKTRSLSHIVSFRSLHSHLNVSWHPKWSHLKLGPGSSVHFPTFHNSVNVTFFYHIPCYKLKGHSWHLSCLLCGARYASGVWLLLRILTENHLSSTSWWCDCLPIIALLWLQFSSSRSSEQKPDWPYKNINGLAFNFMNKVLT